MLIRDPDVNSTPNIPLAELVRRWQSVSVDRRSPILLKEEYRYRCNCHRTSFDFKLHLPKVVEIVMSILPVRSTRSAPYSSDDIIFNAKTSKETWNFIAIDGDDIHNHTSRMWSSDDQQMNCTTICDLSATGLLFGW
jgi:hypothetical protein